MMRAFAQLLERLVLTPSRNRKLELIVQYLRAADDPDRGYGLAAMTGDLDIHTVKPALIRQIASEATDEVLFDLSYDFVGDLAETVALIWPDANDGAGGEMRLSEVVERLNAASKLDAPVMLRDMLNRLDASERFAALKLATGGLRVGISARLAKQALARFGQVDVIEIEEIWHGIPLPYPALFAWLEGGADKPSPSAPAPFRPVMLSHALEQRDHAAISPKEFWAEWKWDGVRVQAVSDGDTRRLYSRTGDDISAAFPDVIEAMAFQGALDGELLVASSGDPRHGTGTFSDLQQRLNRKRVSEAQLAAFPAFIRTYDLLMDGASDLRDMPLSERRKRLEIFVDPLDPQRFDLSQVFDFQDIEELEELRLNPPHPVVEGLMLKRRSAPYVAGRPRGQWFKWKKDPLRVDAVLLYAQRGHGKRSGYYSDFTFGVWRDDRALAAELVPVGKAYFGFTDEELRQLDQFVRDNTVERFGPVRSVRAEPATGLVLEIAFEGLMRSTRHKSGIAMRFPRIARIRWDKPPAEADRLETLEAMLETLTAPTA
jgi:DNA ligase 1